MRIQSSAERLKFKPLSSCIICQIYDLVCSLPNKGKKISTQNSVAEVLEIMRMQPFFDDRLNAKLTLAKTKDSFRKPAWFVEFWSSLCVLLSSRCFLQVVHLDKDEEMQKLPLQPPYYDMAPSESTPFTDKPVSSDAMSGFKGASL